ncbi:unnamed protein product [Periconia digitata]|uniref:Uncharacterized protein n=1 Tax=Periconia digitata TaxID=1303443 RepID=A0A9W4XEK7_9PLEO|nr:unnamed protein product [Periconia digitata]
MDGHHGYDPARHWQDRSPSAIPSRCAGPFIGLRIGQSMHLLLLRLLFSSWMSGLHAYTHAHALRILGV